MNVCSKLLATEQEENKKVVWLKDATWKSCCQKRTDFNFLRCYLY